MFKLTCISILVLLFSMSEVYGIRTWALRRKLLDIPNERSSHTRPTPSGGGLAIVTSTFFGLLLAAIIGGLQ